MFCRDMRNHSTGAWETVYGEIIPDHLLGPCFCVVKLLKEEPEHGGSDLEAKVVDGFHCGWVKGGRVRVGIEYRGHYRFVVSKHVVVFPRESYFEKYSEMRPKNGACRVGSGVFDAKNSAPNTTIAKF